MEIGRAFRPKAVSAGHAHSVARMTNPSRLTARPDSSRGPGLLDHNLQPMRQWYPPGAPNLITNHPQSHIANAAGVHGLLVHWRASASDLSSASLRIVAYARAVTSMNVIAISSFPAWTGRSGSFYASAAASRVLRARGVTRFSVAGSGSGPVRRSFPLSRGSHGRCRSGVPC